MSQLKHKKIKIHGMHCVSCEVLIERKFRKIIGVEKVNVNFASGKAEVFSSRDVSLEEFAEVIKNEGYSISAWEDRNQFSVAAKHKNSKKDYLEIGAIFLFMVAGYLILQRFNLIPESLRFTGHMSYGFIFLIGLV